jgi:endonuclease G
MKYMRKTFIQWVNSRGLSSSRSSGIQATTAATPMQWPHCLAVLRHWLGLIIVIGGVSVSSAQTIHISHCMKSCPSSAGSNSNEIIVRQLFAASINSASGLADWVAYRILEDAVGVASLLPRVWQGDNLPATQSPYVQLSGNTRALNQPDLSGRADQSYRVNELIIDARNNGRMVPMSSFAGTPFWSDLNYLSNLAPLPSELRLGSWSRLDQVINEAAAGSGELFVVSGPVYLIEAGLSTAANSELQLPSAYYKVVANRSSHAAFLFREDLREHVHYCDQLSSLSEIEAFAGLEFFPGIADSADDELVAALNCTTYKDY